MASAAASGSATGTPATPSRPEAAQAPATRATYRHLLMKGMAPEEAANLTAFMAGIHVGEAHWTLAQINQLLFLREMQRSGRFGGLDGASRI